jgi:hypothetical protein
MRRQSGFFTRRRLSPHLSLAACRCSLRPDRGSLTLQPSDACRLATLRLYVYFRRRVIRQKNGADTLYTLHTSRSSGDPLLTNEELPRVASRRREVTQWVQKPFRGFNASMVGFTKGFTLLSRSYYYLRRRSPAPPFLPARPPSGRGTGGYYYCSTTITHTKAGKRTHITVATPYTYPL